MNVQIGNNENHKFSLLYSSNRNGERLTDFLLENELTSFRTKFQKRKRKLWTYTYANNTKAQIEIRNGLIAPVLVRHITLLKVCLLITKLSRQRYVLAYAGM